MSEYDEVPVSEGGSRITGCMVQAVSHGVALVAGLVMGVIIPIAWERYQNPEIMASPEADFSRAELIAKLEAQEKAYAELVAQTTKASDEQKTQLVAASTKVVDLEGQVAKKEAEMQVLQTKLKQSQGKSAARKKELEDAQTELDALKAQLAQAIAEKEQLTQDLAISRAETAQARVETDIAKGQTVDAQWSGFRSDVLLQVCEKGSKNKVDKCREEVEQALNSRRQSLFKKCVSTNQAMPRLVGITDKRDVELPRFAEWVDQNSSFTENKYYIIFCDPDLPESPGLTGEDDL